MSIHISAKTGEIARTVLLAGDPLRAKFIAENYLTDATLVSSTRNIFYYTGKYKNKTITIGASGMGCPSIGIYSFELYTEYGVDCIIRIGTCGAYSNDQQLMDLINVDAAASESTFAKFAWDIDGDLIPHQGNAFDLIHQTAQELGQQIHSCKVHSSDIFYRKDPDTPAIASKYHCPVVEMEAFALFANAKHLGKTAAAILTVSDIIPTHQQISPEAREKSLASMIELALEAAVKM